MTKHWMWGTLAAGLVSLGCSHGSSAERTASAAPPRPADAEAHPGMTMSSICPMAVPGTQVAASDTTSGEALTFSTTSKDQVPELRNRVRAMADMHNRHHASGDMGAQSGMGSGAASTTDPSMRPAHAPPPATASVEDTDDGARVTVTPKDPAQLPQVQSAVRAHAAMMQQQGNCGMASHGM